MRAYDSKGAYARNWPFFYLKERFMLRKISRVCIIAFVFGIVGEIVPANMIVKEAFAESPAAYQRRFGPYATLRRANEVANYARSRGYRAKVIYGGNYIYGTRRYYVDVW